MHDYYKHHRKKERNRILTKRHQSHVGRRQIGRAAHELRQHWGDGVQAVLQPGSSDEVSYEHMGRMMMVVVVAAINSNTQNCTSSEKPFLAAAAAAEAETEHDRQGVQVWVQVSAWKVWASVSGQLPA